MLNCSLIRIIMGIKSMMFDIKCRLIREIIVHHGMISSCLSFDHRYCFSPWIHSLIVWLRSNSVVVYLWLIHALLIFLMNLSVAYCLKSMVWYFKGWGDLKMGWCIVGWLSPHFPNKAVVQQDCFAGNCGRPLPM